MKDTIGLAFYGKGGIGKSTVTANLAAAFGMQGKRVLYIGCDPKADSVRKLTGRRVPTVLQQLSALGEAVRREDVVFPGLCGVQCVEAGGPEAGAGCAGMGLNAMSMELERLGILEEPWDVILYDVLGDVVCSGFSLPMRRQFADRVYIVTSSDYMSLYAANVILKGVIRCAAGERGLLGGLIQNRCRGEDDAELVRLFAERTGARCVGSLLESAEIVRADYQEVPVVCRYPDSPAARSFRALAQALPGLPACPEPRALTDEELDALRLRLLEKAGCADGSGAV